MKSEIPELLHIENLTEEDRAMAIPKGKYYAKEGSRCPSCGGNTIEEQNYGFERVSFCSHCSYSATKTLEL